MHGEGRMSKYTVFIFIALTGLLYGACDPYADQDKGSSTPKKYGYVLVGAHLADVGDIKEKCKENEEKIWKDLSPLAVTPGSYNVRVEACVHTDGTLKFLKAMDAFEAKLLLIEPTDPRIYADQLDKLVREYLSEVGKDRNGNTIPRAYKISLWRYQIVEE